MSGIKRPEDLQGKSLPELSALFRKAQQELVQSDENSEQRREALVSLDNISRAMANRMRF